MGFYKDNGKEIGNYYNGLYRNYTVGYMVGVYRDNGKENGNYFVGFGADIG